MVAQYKIQLCIRGQEEIIPVRQHQEHSLSAIVNSAEANTQYLSNAKLGVRMATRSGKEGVSLLSLIRFLLRTSSAQPQLGCT